MTDRREMFCGGVGLVFWAFGLWFLFNPSVPIDSDTVSQSVVNLQRLTMGETFTIAGSVFLAVAIRPR
jgi:hypothetical protein